MRSTTRDWPSSREATRAVGDRLVRGGVRRPPAVHRGRAARGRRGPARPSQGLPADLRAVRRAAVLRRGRRASGRRRPARAWAWGSRCARTSGTPGPQLLALDGAQVLINVSSSPGRDLARSNEVGLGTADVVADAHADLCPADDVVRRVLQPRRRRRVDHVLGRLRGHRAGGRGRLRRAALRRRAVHSWTSTSPMSAGSGSRCRSCATSARAGRPGAAAGGGRARGAGGDSTAEPGAAPGLDVASRAHAAPSAIRPPSRRRAIDQRGASR